MKQTLTQEQEKRKRRRELIIALAASVLVALIFGVESRLARTAEDIQVAGHLLVFGLLCVVTLLLILVFFFLFRNIFKLIFERRAKVLGSHLKTRLTLAFVGLTLVPTVVLFIASAGVLHTTIESWFKAQVEDSLQSSLVVAQAYYRNASEKALTESARLSAMVEDSLSAGSSGRTRLEALLGPWRQAEGLSSVQVYFRDGSPPVLSMDPQLGDVSIPPPLPSFLKIAYNGEKTSQVMPLEGGGELIRAVAPVKKKGTAGIEAAVMVESYIPNSLAARLLDISNAFGDYQEAKRMKGPVKTIYILLLLMVALLVIFIGFWIGVSMARDITDPLLTLAEGTEKIAGGDLDVYIEPVTDDELGVLVRSFNEMASDLRAGREELVRVNADLENRRKYMETVLKNIAAGVLALDAESNVTTINNSAVALLGITASNLLGRPLSEILPDVSAAAMHNTLEELRHSGTETIERHLTLSYPEKVTTLVVFAGSLADEEGRDLGVVLVFEDMTHLVKAQRMAAWREVARRIAHEIKNPLTPIQLNAQRLKRYYTTKLVADSEVLEQCTRTIVDQVEQLKRMVNEFSKFARLPAANPVPNDLNALIKEVYELYLQGNDGIRFTLACDPGVPIFDLDKEQMKRVMVNLLENAVRAAGPQGSVTVLTGYDPDLSIAAVEVADNGPGIDPRYRDRLFEPYFTRTPGGTGLGLTIVSTIVADHNGFVRVKDNPSGGARFVIELPVGKKR